MKTEEVIKKYFGEKVIFSYKQFAEGATNTTYKLTIEDGLERKDYTLQKVSKFFDPAMMEDIEAFTNHLISKNILIQKVIRTLEGELFLPDEESWWRVLTYIPGKILSALSSPLQAHEAGRLVGSVHQALLDFDYQFKYKIPNFHDTKFIMQELSSSLENNSANEKYEKLSDLARDVLQEYKSLENNSELNKRIIHGDLKISNIVFNDKDEAVTLIDLDTLMWGSVAVELGDALRSWCMKGGEDVDFVILDKEIYDKALEGYFSTAKFLSREEKESIPYGVKLITLELTARFIIDAFNETYFRLNEAKYKSLFEQNKKRAENQYAFFKEYQKLF